MYCSKADILERLDERLLAQLTDDDAGTTVDDAKVERAIADAQAEIDGYVGTRHQMPLSPVPDIVRKVCVELAVYHLYSRRLGAPEEWRTRYEDNRRWLEQVAAGRVSLGVDDPQGTPAAAPVEADSRPRAFSRELLRDF